MRVLVISCHPCDESFTTHVAARAVAVLSSRHQVRHHDLYTGDGTGLLEGTETVVWVYPTWWSGPPARMLEFIHAQFGAMHPHLDKIEKMVVVTSHGSSWWVNGFEGGVGKRLMIRALPTLAAPGCRTRWIAMYDIDRSTEADRVRFVARVERELSRL